MTRGERSALRALAREYGVQTTYIDAGRRRKTASDEVLLACLRSAGAPVEHPRDATPAMRERRASLWRRVVDPVSLAWDGRPAQVAVRVPAQRLANHLECKLEIDGGGEERVWRVRPNELDVLRREDVEGEPFAELGLPLVGEMPLGYHLLSVTAGSDRHESLILSAPSRAFEPAAWRWGLFLPLYALRSSGDWGVGDFGGMTELANWIGETGGDVLAALPLLPAFLDEPFNPSPYSPVSRLFWNELYIDIGKVPELAECDSARIIAGSAEFRNEIEELRKTSMVDYRRTMKLKRRVLEELSSWFFRSGDPARQEAFRRFIAGRPEAEDYARFRGAGSVAGRAWRSWPEKARHGVLTDDDVDVTAMRYHLYAQWISDGQVRKISAAAGERGVDLYLDLPLGVHPDGYDTWRERGAFAQGVTAGAPPDTFFSRGQDWGFPPQQPDGIRDHGYRYLRAVLRHHFTVARILRMDHVMRLHRLYWIPEGMDASQGAYVRYRAEEMYAVLSIESHRHGALIVGEDLGTVPRQVPSAMSRHGIHRTYVLQYEASPEGVRPPQETSVASLNTHDMPPFAAFWQGLDIEDREDLGLLSPEAAAQERLGLDMLKASPVRELRRGGWLDGDGSPDARAAMPASVRMLAGSSARTVLLNLEDLWLERKPQNVPGTWEERPNWRRKAAHTLEEMRAMPQVLRVLKDVGGLRRRKGGNE